MESQPNRLPLRSGRLDALSLLDHPKRATLLTIVKERPGSRLRPMAREIGANVTSTEYHLHKLVRFGHINRKGKGFYPTMRPDLSGRPFLSEKAQ